MANQSDEFGNLISMLFQPNKWHGVSPGPDTPRVLKAYIEMVPTSAVKLELDKESGHLCVDRPQRFSSMCPTLYGFIPQTYCGDSVGALCSHRTGRHNIHGDGDPLDICILSAADFSHGDLFVRAKPIGGLRMIDKGQADDKIIAVLVDDITYGGCEDVSDVPPAVIDRLRHYFLSYKAVPGENRRRRAVDIDAVYGRAEAHEVIRCSLADYAAKFGSAEQRLERLRQLLIAGVAQG
jgi:inorganic pyrophosphatase